MTFTVPTFIPRSMCLVAAIVLSMTPLAGAQSSSSTFNGRILDQADAVLPGVTVTATNQATGVARTTVTNAEGAYLPAGLEPGVYYVATSWPVSLPRQGAGVNLGVNSTLTLDLKLALAGVTEAVTVTGSVPLIEVTQSKVASSIEATEMQTCRCHTDGQRMLALLPGAAPMAPVHRSKENVGSVSFGGASGSNNGPVVDGAENRDNRYGGALLTIHNRSARAVPVGDEPVQCGRWPDRRRSPDDGDQIGDQLPSRIRVYLRGTMRMTAKDYFTKAQNVRKFRSPGGSWAARSAARSSGIGCSSSARSNRSPRTCGSSAGRPVPRERTARRRPRAGLIAQGLVNPNHPRSGRPDEAHLVGGQDQRPAHQRPSQSWSGMRISMTIATP